MAKIMDGKKFADEIKTRVKKNVEELNKFGVHVGLALLLAGENPASRQYFLAIVRSAKKVGIDIYEHVLPETASLNEMLNIIHSVNSDERVNGLLVLFPLPKRINARRVVNAILPEKDVDGLGSLSIGRLAADESTFQIFKEGDYDRLYESWMPAHTSFLPCTPFGVIRLLEHYDVKIKGKHVVVIGKSLAVGKPLSLMFLAKEATVTVCHRETHDLTHFTMQADIVCTATGARGLINGEMVKDGAVIVDIGINVLNSGEIAGDVDFASVEKKASFITPVPGSVGPVTIAMLLENTVKPATRNEQMKSPFII
ncbi:MAG: Bifunctional protein FolD protein [Syntrophomonadaceae bacterium]|nr:Bifunctional protein FolD protein [Bacillota bacterium]